MALNKHLSRDPRGLCWRGTRTGSRGTPSPDRWGELGSGGRGRAVPSRSPRLGGLPGRGALAGSCPPCLCCPVQSPPWAAGLAHRGGWSRACVRLRASTARLWDLPAGCLLLSPRSRVGSGSTSGFLGQQVVWVQPSLHGLCWPPPAHRTPSLRAWFWGSTQRRGAVRGPGCGWPASGDLSGAVPSGASIPACTPHACTQPACTPHACTPHTQAPPSPPAPMGSGPGGCGSEQ